MPEPVGDVLDKTFITASEREQAIHDCSIGQFFPAADVIHRSTLSLVENTVDGVHVVFHIEPIADIFSFCIKRHFFTLEQKRNEFWNKLCVVLMRSIIV